MNSNEQDRSRHKHRHGRGRKFLKIPMIIGFILIKSALVLFLWNELVPELFHGPVITYLQAIELAVLVKLLVGFGGFGGFRGSHHHMGHHHGRFGRGHFGRGPFGRGHHMPFTEEERQKLREDLEKRYGK